MAGNLRCLTNENLEFQYDVLAKIIKDCDLDHIPVVIYSVAGPTRTGKSYLLNVLHYRLSNRHTNVDMVENDRFEIPQVFESTRQSDQQTKGIYITAKPIVIEIGSNKKVAVFLMDTQGIEAGEQIEWKEADIFTISSTLSFMQIINVKNRLGWKDVDSYAALALFSANIRNEVISECSTLKTRSMAVVRDWENPGETDGFGSRAGKLHYEAKLHDTSLRQQFECLGSYFAASDCFLISHPGKRIATTNSKLKSDIDHETWQEFLALYHVLFSPSTLEEALDATLKGKDLLLLARQLGNKLSSPGRVSAPDSSFKNYFDLIMKQKVAKCLKFYKTEMDGFTQLKGKELRIKHLEVKQKAIVTLRTENAVRDVTEYVEILHANVETEYEIYKGRHLLNKYADEWIENIRKKGKFSTDEVRDFFTAEGKRYMDAFKASIPDEDAQRIVISEFMVLMSTLYNQEFERRQENQRIAICIAATLGGLGFGIGIAFIPPFLATAAASTVAAELTVALISGGLGAGGASYGMTKYFQDRQDRTVPDLTEPENNSNENQENCSDQDLLHKSIEKLRKDVAKVLLRGIQKKEQ